MKKAVIGSWKAILQHETFSSSKHENMDINQNETGAKTNSSSTLLQITRMYIPLISRIHHNKPDFQLPKIYSVLSRTISRYNPEEGIVS